MWTRPLQLLQTQSGALGVEVFSIGKENSHKWSAACFDSVWLLRVSCTRGLIFGDGMKHSTEKAIWRTIKVHKRNIEAKQIGDGTKKTVLAWTACGLATEMYTPLGDWNLPGDYPVTGRMGTMVMIYMKEFFSLSLRKMLNIKMALNLSILKWHDYTLRLGDEKDLENPTGKWIPFFSDQNEQCYTSTALIIKTR